MGAAAITENWALLAAAIPAALVFVWVGLALYGRSAPGKLRAVLKDHRRAMREVRAAKKAAAKAADRVASLERKVDRVKPRLLEEAKGLSEDTRALEKIATDRLLVTANHVRRVIHEEFPPARQEKLRQRYLPGDGPDGRPFSFDS